MKLRITLALVLALGSLAQPGAAAAPRQDAAGLIAQLREAKDDADPKLIADLAGLRTREAMVGLLDLYENAMVSVYMRREIVRALGRFDGVAEAEQPALQKLTDVATGSLEPELRNSALDTLGECSHLGKHFLQTIVESAAEDSVRERAMEKVVRLATKDDQEFFERVFKGPVSDQGQKVDKPKKDKGKKKDEEPAEAQRKVNAVRAIQELAFQQLAAGMALPRLYEYARAKERGTPDELEKWGLRRLALLEIEKRKDKGLIDLARAMYEAVDERGSNRAEAARVLGEALGSAMADQFLEDGCKSPDVMPEETRIALADQLARLRDDAVDRKLAKLIGKGAPFEQRFALRALRGYKDEKFVKALAKELVDGTKKAPPEKNDPKYNDHRDLLVAMLGVLGASKDEGVLVELEGVVDKFADETVVAAAMEAVGAIRANDAEWLKKLEGLTTNPRIEVRNAALATLGKSGDARYVPLLAKALENGDWSTRFAALNALESLRVPEAVGAIVARMDQETGLMLARFADALWRLTGRPYRTSAAAWKSWWERDGKAYAPISAAELDKLQAEEEMRRLKQTTKTATFFGIRIVSHRVLFIIDVSGSMNEPTRSEYVGRQGKPRIDVAKAELTKCIDALAADSLFNIITFSAGVQHWLDGGIAQSGKASKDDAKKFVATLGANGGTNLYDALREGFSDPDVDTIFVLSDGEPTVGEVMDQYVIRERVKQWNEHRGIVIHTVAVGGSLQILEWLAADTGGTHKKFQ